MRKICPACGKSISRDAAVCPRCGAVLSGTACELKDPWEREKKPDPWNRGGVRQSVEGFHTFQIPPEGCGCPRNPEEKKKMKAQSRKSTLPGPGKQSTAGAAAGIIALCLLPVLLFLLWFVL